MRRVFAPLQIGSQSFCKPIFARRLGVGFRRLQLRFVGHTAAEGPDADRSFRAGLSSLNLSLAFRLARRQALWQCPPRSQLKAFPRVVLVGARAFSWVASANSGCRSSVVEHSLGKGEVESSIPSGSTSFIM